MLVIVAPHENQEVIRHFLDGVSWLSVGGLVAQKLIRIALHRAIVWYVFLGVFVLSMFVSASLLPLLPASCPPCVRRRCSRVRLNRLSQRPKPREKCAS